MICGMDMGNQLIETWQINDRLNRYLLAETGADRVGVALAKGKSVADQFAHIHNVRLMWIKASAPELMEGMEKIEKGDGTFDLLNQRLEISGEAIASLLLKSIEAGGKVKNFKPHATAFVAYLVAHEANHRGQIEVALRQAGVPLSDKAGYGLWEWGVR